MDVSTQQKDPSLAQFLTSPRQIAPVAIVSHICLKNSGG